MAANYSEFDWKFDDPAQKLIVNGNLTPICLDLICAILRNHGRIAITTCKPEEVSCAKLVADLLNAR